MSNDIQPEIRFPGFTEAWEQRKFECLLDKKDGVRRGPFGSALKKEFFVSNSNFVVYEQQNAIYDNYETRYKITEKKYNELIKFKLEPGDFIMSGAGTIGRISRVPKQIKPGVFNQALIRLRINKEITDSEYFIQFIRADFMQRKLTGANPGSAITNLVPMSEVKKWIVQFPILEEQKKIGNFFKQLDDTIALHQRKLDLLKETKKGFLQKMFPKNGAKVPEIRFPGFTEDWEERKFGETKTYFTDGNYGESYPSSKDMSDKENGVPFLRGSDFSNGYLDSSNANYIKYEKHQELTSGHIKQDDIVIAVRGSLGTLGYANKENEGWNINSQLAILRTNKSEILGMFLIQYLLSNKGQKEILSRNTGTALKQLPIKQLKDIPIPMPAISEQQKIGTFFKQLDDTIALHQRKLDLLKETKKGFLQKMFV
ncbi:restriction endonuclease subunit S [Enterococcus lactis]|uniref:restriction endonuclease subunit S n=2 Tax=Enterococcus TaxID=1350 RepID=UPI001A0132EB|nr:restriction endonuclease subunit S [Enterococcus lactis]EGP5413859.1 restriction endonuclease subunit S [Enterococcus faecium]